MKQIDKITEFTGHYDFLSMFYPCDIEYEGITYPSLAHAYYASMTLSSTFRQRIAKSTSPRKEAESMNKRADWDVLEIRILWTLTQKKFKIPALREKLLNTGDTPIEFWNWYGDTHLGMCNGIGDNFLGKLLERVRLLVKLPV